jgi:hypothetical protein
MTASGTRSARFSRSSSDEPDSGATAWRGAATGATGGLGFATGRGRARAAAFRGPGADRAGLAAFRVACLALRVVGLAGRRRAGAAFDALRDFFSGVAFFPGALVVAGRAARPDARDLDLPPGFRGVFVVRFAMAHPRGFDRNLD